MAVTLQAAATDGNFWKQRRGPSCASAVATPRGWTSAGFGLPSVIPWIGGHTEHLWGGVRGVYVLPDDSDGGLYIRRWGEGAD